MSKSNKIITGVVILAVVLIAWSRFSIKSETENDPTVISTNGLHWHPELSIKVKGEDVPIPANIGLVGGHSPMHTHDPDGVIHLEFEGLVKEEDVRLGEFFKLWNKNFSSTQLLENFNSETEKVTMLVNGEVNTEFENYLLKDGDKVELRFE